MIKEIEKGDTVSYGCTFKADKKTKIATAPVGYADGFWRSNAENGTQMLIRGQRVNIVGRVCMDQLMLDVTDVKGVREGDYITLIGGDKDEFITADELAKNNGTIGYEMICAIGERVPRFYIKDHEIVYVKDITDVDSMGVSGTIFKINLSDSSFSVRKGYAHTGGNVTIEKSSEEIFCNVLNNYVAYFL
jgi:hypothetical protein